MASIYNRNIRFLQQPRREERLGRYTVAADTLQLTPVVVTGVTDGNGQQSLIKAPANTHFAKGRTGLVLWETPNTDFPGFDPVLMRSSDFDTIPAGVDVQLISGVDVRLELINTEARSFDGQRDYAGRVVVAGLSIATPTIAEGDLLTPGVGDGTSGYWKETSTAAEAWLRVLNVYENSVHVQMLF